MPTPRFRAAAVNVSHHVYLFGGRDVNGTLVRNIIKRHKQPSDDYVTMRIFRLCSNMTHP